MKKSLSRFFIVKENGVLHTAYSKEDALQEVQDGGYCWFDYCEPTKDDLTPLIDLLGIHPLTIEDSLNEDQLPKLDLFPNYSFMIMGIFEMGEEELLTHELDLIIGSNFIISIAGRNQAGQPLLRLIDKSIKREQDKISQGPAFLLHLLIDQVVDQKFNALEKIEDRMDDYEASILDSTPDFNPADLMDARRNLMTIRKNVFHERELLLKIIRRDSPFVSDKAVVYFRDVYDHLSKYYEIADSARDLVTSLMEIHLSMINNRMSQTSNRTNAIMRRLTLITTIFMPLSLLSGIGGMSEFTLIFGQNNVKLAYLGLFLFMALIAGGNWWLLKRMEKQIPAQDLDED